MAPIHTFDQALIGLGIYIPASPSSSGPSSAALLSPPRAFLTPRAQTRPRTFGTRNAFRPLPAGVLPRSIYAGEDNPFLPYPEDEDELDEEAVVDEADETSEELRPVSRPGKGKGKRRQSKEYDDVVLPLDLEDLEGLPESTFTPSSHQLLSPAYVARSSTRRVTGRNLGTFSGGADPNSAALSGPGPDPSFPPDEVLGIPQTPRPAPSTDDGAPFTPSTPIPSISALASPRPTPGVGTATGSMGLVASALAEDIAPVTNPLFAASVALSVVLGVLIVGIVTCSVAYCRRNKRGEGDEEKVGGGRGAGGPSSPKRSLEGVYARGLGTPRSFLKSSDTLTSFSTRTSTMVDSVESRPGSILKSPGDKARAGEVDVGEAASGGRVSFVEMLDGDLSTQVQLYSPPTWQPGQSSPLAQAAPIYPPSTPAGPSPSDPSPSDARRTPSQTPTASSSRQSICAVPPLDSIREESVDSHAPHAHPPSSRSSGLLHPSSSLASSGFPHLGSDEEGESVSYHSCSDNSSMTTHASDDAFGYTSRPTSIAGSSLGGGSKSLTSLADLSVPDRTSIASSVPSFDYPLYLIDELEVGSELDMSFDTLSSVSVQTPRSSPSPPPSLDSPLPHRSVLGGAAGKKERRKTVGDWMGSPSVRLRTRFAVEDEEDESESELSSDEDGEGADVVEGVSAEVVYLTALPTSPSGDIQRSLSLPTKPIPASGSKSVLKRALSALRANSATPPLPPSSFGQTLTLAELPYGPPTPPRISRTKSLSRPSPTTSSVPVIIHQSDIDARGQSTSSASPSSSSTPLDSPGIARFSTASWDQLGQGDGFDAYYLGYDGVSGAGMGAGSENGEEDDEGDILDVMAEINHARISFGFLSTDLGQSECAFGPEELEGFPEPASHLPQIRVSIH